MANLEITDTCGRIEVINRFLSAFAVDCLQSRGKKQKRRLPLFVFCGRLRVLSSHIIAVRYKTSLSPCL